MATGRGLLHISTTRFYRVTGRDFYGAPDAYLTSGQQYAKNAKPKKEIARKCLLISGSIHKRGSGKFRPFYLLTDRVPDRPKAEGEYSIEQRDREGKVVHVFHFNVNFLIDNYAGKAVTITSFSFMIPYSDKTETFLLKHGKKVYDKVKVSPNAPEVKIISPARKEKLNGVYTVKWRGRDADGDSLTYAILYSNDGKGTWVALATGISKTKYNLKTNKLPGSRNAYIRILATDGVNTTMADSDEVIIESKKPMAFIIRPENNASFALGDSVLFMGQGYDLEDGSIKDKSLLWISNKDGYLGSGRTIELKKLSAAVHTITLVALDREGEVGTATITLSVIKK